MTAVPPPAFTPRLTAPVGPAPYNPSAYFLLSFFGGAFALAFIAVRNLDRITTVHQLRSRTYGLVAAMLGLALAFLVLSPAGWWQDLSTIRLGLRVIAVIASAGLYTLHKGPAMGTLRRHPDYMSMWKSIGYIVVFAILQGLMTSGVGMLRGVL